jgi:glucose/arabinose dehydrogenase
MRIPPSSSTRSLRPATIPPGEAAQEERHGEVRPTASRRDIKTANPCDKVVLPVVTLGPHTAALGMRFYTGTMFPADYREAIFVARRGSWNRTEKMGYDVLTVRATPDGKNAQVTPFMTGFLDKAKNEFWGRPVDVLQIPDGSLLVADEQVGAIYRVSYKK